MKKYCTRCGKPFDAVGREVICPSCKAQAAVETKRAAVLKAKRASWTGVSVPVRISGRASTIIREYGKQHNLPFAQALDALLQASDFAGSLGKWDDITPYKSRRRDKATSTAETAPQDVPQDAKQEVKQDAKQEVKQEVKPVKQAAKQASKATASKATASKATASKASASKTAGKAASKASKASKM